MSEKFRLVTRSDFDGLACAMMLRDLDLIDDIKFVHPKDMQDGVVEISDRDITTNLPYVEGVHLAFDHHSSEEDEKHDNYINKAGADSAARVVYDYFGGPEKLSIPDDFLEAVDKADSAKYTFEDIVHPDGWVLLSYLMDPRTGLGRFRNFRISNYDLMMELIDFCRNHTIEQILELGDIKERTDLYFEQQGLFKKQLQRICKVHGDVVVIDLREEEIIYAGNRFFVYAMFPEAKISVHVMWGLNKQNTAVAIGKSIIDRSSQVDIGALCHQYGGGGHHNAGTCQLDNDKVDGLLPGIIEALQSK